ncbi:MAG: adenylate kinase [Candidatus Aenigmatarchaeota archaeon]
MKSTILVLLGAPGSGKGTHSKVVAEKLSLPVVSTGVMLREAVAKQTPLGKKAKAIMDAGKLVDDEIVIGIVKERLAREKTGCILDGFPRSIVQAKALEEFAPVTTTILLDVPDKELIKRLSGRWQCKCGEIYNIPNKVPKKKGVCDKCNERLFQREDDKPEAVKKRLEIYHKDTKPLIEFYRKKNVLVTVDAVGDIEEVDERILKALK